MLLGSIFAEYFNFGLILTVKLGGFVDCLVEFRTQRHNGVNLVI